MKIEKHVFTLNTIRQTKTGRFACEVGGVTKYFNHWSRAFWPGVVKEFTGFAGGSPEYYVHEFLTANSEYVAFAQLGLSKMYRGPSKSEMELSYNGFVSGVKTESHAKVSVSPDGLMITVEYQIAETYAETPAVTHYTKQLRDIDEIRRWVDTRVAEDVGGLVTDFIKRCRKHVKYGMGLPADILDNFEWLIAYADEYGL